LAGELALDLANIVHELTLDNIELEVLREKELVDLVAERA
jgi:hypothetical protein